MPSLSRKTSGGVSKSKNSRYHTTVRTFPRSDEMDCAPNDSQLRIMA
jgi:hypothetical protein